MNVKRDYHLEFSLFMQILKVEDAASCNKKDNRGKCNQQIGRTVKLNDFRLPLPGTCKIDVVRHSIFQNNCFHPVIRQYLDH